MKQISCVLHISHDNSCRTVIIHHKQAGLDAGATFFVFIYLCVLLLKVAFVITNHYKTLQHLTCSVLQRKHILTRRPPCLFTQSESLRQILNTLCSARLLLSLQRDEEQEWRISPLKLFINSPPFVILSG